MRGPASEMRSRHETLTKIPDTKSVTAWNGMTIAAYAQAYDVLGDGVYRETAVTASEFLRSELSDSDTLFGYRDRTVAHNANQKDNAYLA